MIELLKKNGKFCTGCGACYNICPKDAICMEANAQGFLYPQINNDLCIHCSLCQKVCPKLGTEVSNALEPKCYAARANDTVRAESSSGGIFTLLAKWVLNQEGVVCGATMEPDYRVHHICITDEDELAKLKKSKYVQSNTEYVYREIDQFLQTGRTVLFSGCPCQVAAARKYFGDKYENIYYVDILCHGTPSQKMWNDYLHENFDLSRVKSIDFRNKANGWRSDQLYVQWLDGSSNAVPWPESAYEEGFQRNISLRDGCEECEFAGHQRQGDLTLGDFWQVEKYDPSLNDRKGTSVVLVNNSIGQKLLMEIKSQLIDLKQTPIEAARYNRLNATVHVHPQRERFKALYPGHTFSDAIMQCRDNTFDIGVIGNYTIGNYGGSLTQYALYCTLIQLGFSVLMIERPLDAPEPPHSNPWLFEKSPYPSYALARRFKNITEMKLLNKQCKVFVTGSDQMFNNNLYNAYGKIQVQNFVQNNRWKIAYAASFGHDRIWGRESDRAEEAFFMQQFDRFSVREDSAVELSKTMFGVNATWVLDPVFTAPIENYLKLIKRCKQSPPRDPYLFAYVLDPSKEKENILKNIALSEKLTIRAISDVGHQKDKVTKQWNIDTLFGAKIETWLSHIYHCNYFVTDSFHGMCFAIMFHKQFLVLVNKRRGETRFTSLLGLLGLTERLCYSEDELKHKGRTLTPINYNVVDEILERERNRSIQWLYDSIKAGYDVKKSFTSYDILDARCDLLHAKLEQQYNELQKKIQEASLHIEHTAQDITPEENNISLESIPTVQFPYSYKIGCSITWLPRQIQRIYLFSKEHGWQYTIRYIFSKVRNRKQ